MDQAIIQWTANYKQKKSILKSSTTERYCSLPLCRANIIEFSLYGIEEFNMFNQNMNFNAEFQERGSLQTI